MTAEQPRPELLAHTLGILCRIERLSVRVSEVQCPRDVTVEPVYVEQDNGRPIYDGPMGLTRRDTRRAVYNAKGRLFEVGMQRGDWPGSAMVYVEPMFILPVVGGDADAMMLISTAIHHRFRPLWRGALRLTTKGFRPAKSERPVILGVVKEMRETLSGCRVQIIKGAHPGVMVSGPTYPLREALKGYGLEWCQRRKVWHGLVPAA